LVKNQLAFHNARWVSKLKYMKTCNNVIVSFIKKYARFTTNVH